MLLVNRLSLVVVFMFCITSTNIAQKPSKLSWKVLSKMKFEEIYNAEYGFKVPYPIFNSQVKALKGKKVIIEGYVIPLEAGDDHSILVLSKFPESSCFFCGMAGPETVVDVLPRHKIKNRDLNLQGKMKFQGTLKLNRDNLDHMNYMLLDATIVK